MKNDRQSKILELIKEYEISTQEVLIAKLREHGFDATQTTISRDIRQLRLVKGPTGRGSYKYVAPGAVKEAGAPVHNSALTESVLKIETAENIVVIKTHAGMANAIAVCVESLDLHHIVGSVAGDDTILLVIKDKEKAISVENELLRIFGL
jgi:transcriptional regulator of arginine metabolism